MNKKILQYILSLSFLLGSSNNISAINNDENGEKEFVQFLFNNDIDPMIDPNMLWSYLEILDQAYQLLCQLTYKSYLRSSSLNKDFNPAKMEKEEFQDHKNLFEMISLDSMEDFIKSLEFIIKIFKSNFIFQNNESTETLALKTKIEKMKEEGNILSKISKIITAIKPEKQQSDEQELEEQKLEKQQSGESSESND